MDSAQVNDLVLQHWGIRGMKWGVRRFQNKDGSLTAEGRIRYSSNSDADTDSDSVKPKLSRKQRKQLAKAIEDAETIEQKRERLLRSSDASELYKNKELLTTSEIQERIYRIDTEQRLADVAKRNQRTKKTVLDRVDTALKYGKKINEVYEFTNTPVMKALKKKLGLSSGDDDNKAFDIEKVYTNRDKLSAKDIQEAANRAENYNKIKKMYDDVVGEAKQKEDSVPKPDLPSGFESGLSKPTKFTSGKAKKYGKTQFDETDAVEEFQKNVKNIEKKVKQSDNLKKEAVSEIVKEVGPELDEVLTTFNDVMLKANQYKLDDYYKNN